MEGRPSLLVGRGEALLRDGDPGQACQLHCGLCLRVVLQGIQKLPKCMWAVKLCFVIPGQGYCKHIKQPSGSLAGIFTLERSALSPRPLSVVVIQSLFWFFCWRPGSEPLSHFNCIFLLWRIQNYSTFTCKMMQRGDSQPVLARCIGLILVVRLS